MEESRICLDDQGEKYGKQPVCPVAIPPISDLLGRRIWNNQAITPGISEQDFERIRDKALSLEFNTKSIPLLGRQPNCEQEVLSILVAGYQQFGINRILKVQTRFPDVLVDIKGKQVWLELEVYSEGFKHHLDDLRLLPGTRNRRMARLKDKEDDRPVAVLCWVDNNKRQELTTSIKGLQIFELQTLLRTKKKIML